MEQTPHPAIEVHGLRKLYAHGIGVEDVGFSVLRGRIVGLLGPNGAGKTTTLRMLLGLIRPDRGTALIDGVEFAELSDPAATVGAFLDDGGLHPGRTGRQHLRIAAAMAGVSATRVDTVLGLVDMRAAADRRVAGYSLGMRQRIGLAAALIAEPRILVLDEPATGLDPVGVRWLRERLRSHAAAGGAVLISSHQLAEVSQLVDDVIVVAEGRVLAAGPLDERTAAYGGDLEPFYLELTTRIPEAR